MSKVLSVFHTLVFLMVYLVDPIAAQKVFYQGRSVAISKNGRTPMKPGAIRGNRWMVAGYIFSVGLQVRGTLRQDSMENGGSRRLFILRALV
jgi:hypothetical protein